MKSPSPYEDLDYLKNIGYNKKDILEIINLPKNSYTANRLLYLTPKELSKHEVTTLLGDVPKDIKMNKGFRRNLNISQLFKRKQASINIKYVKQRTVATLNNTTDTGKVHNSKNITFLPTISESESKPLLKKVNVDKDNAINYRRIHSRNNKKLGRYNKNGNKLLNPRIDKISSKNIIDNESQSYFTANNITSEIIGKLEQSNNLVNKRSINSLKTYGESIESLPRDPGSESDYHFNLKSICEFNNHPSSQHVDTRSYIIDKDYLNVLEPKPMSPTKNELDVLLNNENKRKPVFTTSNRHNSSHNVKIVSMSSNKDSEKYVPKFHLKEKVMVIVMASDAYPCHVNEFGDIKPLKTRVLERWKEYLLKVKSTCKNSILDVQFSKTDKNSSIIEEFTSDNSLDDNFCINFSISKPSQIQLYGTLDKTLCIQRNRDNNNEKKKENKFRQDCLYIICFRTRQSALVWYKSIHDYFGVNNICTDVSLYIPSLKITLKINFNELYMQYLRKEEIKNQETLKLMRTKHGYFTIPSPIIKYLNVVIFERLLKNNTSLKDKIWDRKHLPFGLSFKFYDRLEWFPETLSTLLFEKNISKKGFCLEFRKFNDTSSNLTEHRQLNKFINPVPVEGFIINIVDMKNYSSQNVIASLKYLYGVTMDNLLILVPSQKATPPETFNEWRKRTCLKLSEEVYSEHRYSQASSDFNPFPLGASGNISWLKLSVLNYEFEVYDTYAEEGFKRKVYNVVNSESVLLLDDICDIYVCNGEKFNYSKRSLKSLLMCSYRLWGDRNNMKNILASMVILVNKTGKEFKFLAQNPEVAEKWVTHLRLIQDHWKRYTLSRKRSILTLRNRNIQFLNLSETEESNINNTTQKWILNRGISNARIYNIRSFAMLNPILHQGYICQKKNKYSTYDTFFAILIPGFIILFELFTRSISGFSKDEMIKKCKLIIPLKGSYIYSGNITGLDFGQKRQQHNYTNPSESAMPRACSDGWKSHDTELCRTFVLWFSCTNFSASDNICQGYENSFLNNKSSLDKLSQNVYQENIENVNKRSQRMKHSNKSAIFLTKLRQDKDLWVLAIQYELDRLNN
ncbi:hypothetical protein TPHA_0A01880 [Tetrapisispora phaffii CBS 4417]|uniref:Sporulation-specific protein 71 N-terminal domain-containing protein n=1 Tax=Tetrapisispora phaffii (strain ATCC 24235 / CBS 4417 / NBRC 1672 / NRRL Y-8282 / UCD 70-5) TaxID=1071381 RepID=G8BMZ3_TETPH|nr:hypothetical protein TPHA_0A01880 [Tetrapisispora phaffii CBS 4417]CCE61271.1 hypothetical protein TPHA_0A01880 [Tetrapisispora phaffii CBS 4417]